MITVIDPFGIERRVSSSAEDPEYFEGHIDVDGEPMRVWLPKERCRVVTRKDKKR